MPTGGRVAAAKSFSNGLFRGQTPNATVEFNNLLTVSEALYITTYVADFGTPAANNVFQIKFLEPIIDAYFQARGGDKLDATARQNYFDSVIKWVNVLINLMKMWRLGTLNPKITRSDTAYGYPMTLSTWESAMSMLESQQLTVPVLALNIAKIFAACVFQLSPGNVAARQRPSYLMLGYPWLAWTGTTDTVTYPTNLRYKYSIEAIITSIIQEYDSKIFIAQTGMPGVKFTRGLVEDLTVIHPTSSLGMLYGHMLASKDVNNAETDYLPLCDGTTDIKYSDLVGGLMDDYALLPLFRVYSSADGGVCRNSLGVAQDKISVRTCTYAAGGNWSTDIAAGAYPIASSMTSLMDAQNLLAASYHLALHGKILENVLPSAASWNQRFASWATMKGLIDSPLKWSIAGHLASLDAGVTGGVSSDSTGAVDYPGGIIPGGIDRSAADAHQRNAANYTALFMATGSPLAFVLARWHLDNASMANTGQGPYAKFKPDRKRG